DHLLLKFMKVVIENAGAERGLFLLNSDGVFTIEVEYSIQNKETLKLNSISLDSELLPLSIINYTGLSKEILVLSDAGKNSRFRNDNYIQENKVKSILCMPILNQNNLIGILYLENKIASNVFTKTRINILEILGAQIAISIQNARLYQHMEDKVKERTKELNNSLKLIQKDLLVAKKIQEKTLTFESKLIEELEIIPIYIPMSEVGGDFYTVSKYSDFTYRVFLADATGHGVQAALITMAIKGIYDNIKNLKIQLNEVMEILNNEFINRYSILNAFFTAIIIDIDVKNHKINYVSAGHPQGILLKNGKLDKFLKKTGKLIGIENDVFYNSVKFDFFPGDRIFIFTDGIFEEFNTEYEEFGEKRLYEEFEKNSNLNIFDSIQNVQSELNKFIMGKEMEDDITVIGIGYKEK
ncbi:MAG: SpoIIE family protein phosphatase, partial [Leptospiraceae bacterium]|nr:SpoIIE family protein phosphatase [Leptospiraceae bacterium]